MKDIQHRKRRKPAGNKLYKTLGFKWLFKRSVPH